MKYIKINKGEKIRRSDSFGEQKKPLHTELISKQLYFKVGWDWKFILCIGAKYLYLFSYSPLFFSGPAS